jgi:hypothetical protein
MQKPGDGLLIGVQDMGNGELVFADDPIFRSLGEREADVGDAISW